MGVDRGPGGPTGAPNHRPHACGGGPKNFPSPQALGAIVPTRVGVDRTASAGRRRPTHRPHACGGGPPVVPVRAGSRPSSPRVWGWTGRDRSDGARGLIVPRTLLMLWRPWRQPQGVGSRRRAVRGRPRNISPRRSPSTQRTALADHQHRRDGRIATPRPFLMRAWPWSRSLLDTRGPGVQTARRRWCSGAATSTPPPEAARLHPPCQAG